jgi:hypothetical protein
MEEVSALVKSKGVKLQWHSLGVMRTCTVVHMQDISVVIRGLVLY